MSAAQAQTRVDYAILTPRSTQDSNEAQAVEIPETGKTNQGTGD